MIHATNAWNPTGQNLTVVPDTRLYYVHAESLSGPRTFVLLGDQQHLTFVADFEGHVPVEQLRQRVLDGVGLYPHLVDDAAPGPEAGRVLPPQPDARQVLQPRPEARQVLQPGRDARRVLEPERRRR